MDSLLAQTFEDFEIIISDNASTDRTAEIARDYAARDGRIRYYRNEENVGAARNFDITFEHSKGQGRPLLDGTIAYLAAEQSAPWDRVPALEPGDRLLASAWRATLELLLYHLERPPRALKYLTD